MFGEKGGGACPALAYMYWAHCSYVVRLGKQRRPFYPQATRQPQLRARRAMLRQRAVRLQEWITRCFLQVPVSPAIFRAVNSAAVPGRTSAQQPVAILAIQRPIGCQSIQWIITKWWERATTVTARMPHDDQHTRRLL